MRVPTLSPKRRALQAIDLLPDDASFEDVLGRLILLYKVEQGMEEAQRGEGVMTQSEVEAQFVTRRAARAVRGC